MQYHRMFGLMIRFFGAPVHCSICQFPNVGTLKALDTCCYVIGVSTARDDEMVLEMDIRRAEVLCGFTACAPGHSFRFIHARSCCSFCFGRSHYTALAS